MFSSSFHNFGVWTSLHTAGLNLQKRLAQQFFAMIPKIGVEEIKLLDGHDDAFGGVTVDMKEPMDPELFSHVLRASLSQWKQQGKKGIWISLPIELANLLVVIVQEGFRYHHAEPSYLMLVKWVSETDDTIPANASHRVGIGAFVTNDIGEACLVADVKTGFIWLKAFPDQRYLGNSAFKLVLVVQEKNGKFKGSGVWKFPTGVVDEGEDICMAAIREVKEETGIDAEFLEILAFRQSHNSFFGKSDLFFVCMLRPLSFDIQKQISEIEDAKWMALEEYAAQPFNQKNEQFKYIADICLQKNKDNYTGFSTITATSGFSSKRSSLYFNHKDLKP